MRRRGILGLLQTLVVLFLFCGPHAAPVVRAVAEATEIEVECELLDADSAIVSHGRRVPGGPDLGKSDAFTRAVMPRPGSKRSAHEFEPLSFLPKSRAFWIWAWSQTWCPRA